MSLQTAILGAVFLTVVLLVLGTAFALERRSRSVGRLERLASAAGAQAGESESGRRFRELLARIGANMVPGDSAGKTAVDRRLAQAGYRSRNAVSFYYGTRIFLALSLPISAGLVLYVTGQATPVNGLLASMAVAVLGFYLPVVWVAQQAGRRRQQISDGFPDALDMLLVCVEAGAGLPAGLQRVGQEVARPHPVLAEELALVALEINAGTARAEALRRFAERVGTDDVASFATLLIQSDAFGTSIADSLRVQANDMRRKRMLRAEENANKLPVKISLPLVLFIFPALLIVIMTPVLIRIMESIKMTS